MHFRVINSTFFAKLCRIYETKSAGVLGLKDFYYRFQKTKFELWRRQHLLGWIHLDFLHEYGVYQSSYLQFPAPCRK